MHTGHRAGVRQRRLARVWPRLSDGGREPISFVSSPWQRCSSVQDMKVFPNDGTLFLEFRQLPQSCASRGKLLPPQVAVDNSGLQQNNDQQPTTLLLISQRTFVVVTGERLTTLLEAATTSCAQVFMHHTQALKKSYVDAVIDTHERGLVGCDNDIQCTKQAEQPEQEGGQPKEQKRNGASARSKP